MAEKKRLYYNPIEIAYPIHYYSKERNIDLYLDDSGNYNGEDYLDELFKALKKGEYDEIEVKIISHNDAYYPEPFILNGKKAGYQRIPVKGIIKLSEFENGGGYLKDKHDYLYWEMENRKQ